jgi:hypothetical protein
MGQVQVSILPHQKREERIKFWKRCSGWKFNRLEYWIVKGWHPPLRHDRYSGHKDGVIRSFIIIGYYQARSGLQMLESWQERTRELSTVEVSQRSSTLGGPIAWY